MMWVQISLGIDQLSVAGWRSTLVQIQSLYCVHSFCWQHDVTILCNWTLFVWALKYNLMSNLFLSWKQQICKLNVYLLRCSITNFKQLKWASGSCLTASRILCTCSPIEPKPKTETKITKISHKCEICDLLMRG